jgi:uncharacterized protein with ACT and thioredoxin-like domain
MARRAQLYDLFAIERAPEIIDMRTGNCLGGGVAAVAIDALDSFASVSAALKLDLFVAVTDGADVVACEPVAEGALG